MSDGNTLIQNEDGKLEILDEFMVLAGRLRTFQALVRDAGNLPKIEYAILRRLAIMMVMDTIDGILEDDAEESLAEVGREIRDYLDLDLKDECSD